MELCGTYPEGRLYQDVLATFWADALLIYDDQEILSLVVREIDKGVVDPW